MELFEIEQLKGFELEVDNIDRMIDKLEKLKEGKINERK